MAVAAEADLLRSGQLARIKGRLAVSARMFLRAQMTAPALDARHHRLQIARDGGGMATQAALHIARVLFQPKCGLGIRRSTGVLSNGDSVLMQLREIADAGFAHAVECLDQRCLTLRAG